MSNIYGAIGYTVLEKDNHYILIFADKHDNLDKCNYMQNISDYLRSKFLSSNILLEEIPRNEKLNLMELFSDSDHTQDLKNLYLENKHIIKPIDIRPYLVPFNWEYRNNSNKNILFKKYLTQLRDFYSLKLTYFISNLTLYNIHKLINTKLGTHFINNKNKFNNFIIENKHLLYNKLDDIGSDILNNLNIILDNTMEWYCCAVIMSDMSKNVIIHTGLYHSENIVNNFIDIYGYGIIFRNGVNSIGDIKMELEDSISGCVSIKDEIDNKFGGFFSKIN